MMETNEYKILFMKANEAFIRRAVEVPMPFMLKGSYVTSQYFECPQNRIPGDLDWLYMKHIPDVETARIIFNDWATRVTELQLFDGAQFISFRENAFWRQIDYAMAEDFPTINTDLRCVINGEEVDLCVDISFNLPVHSSVPLLYTPTEGEPFWVPRTPSVGLQVAWKIHQTLVRPRFKDLYDLMHLVQHPAFDQAQLEEGMRALVEECKSGNVDLAKLKYFLLFDLAPLFPYGLRETWDQWRHNIPLRNTQGFILYGERVENITDASLLPHTIAEFMKELKTHLKKAGFGVHLYEKFV